MKIKYNKKTILFSAIIVFVFCVEVHFFGLIKMPEAIEFILYKNRSKWIAPLAVLLCIVCWKFSGHTVLKKYSKFLVPYLLTVFTAVSLLYFDAFIRYPLNSLITTYGLGAYYFYGFLSVPILYIFEMHGSYENMLKIITVMVIIMYIVSILQGITYLRTGGLLFASAGSDIIEGVMTRNGKIRIGAGAFANIILIYHVYNLYNNSRKKDHRWISVLVITLALGNIIFTGQTRMLLFSTISSILILIYMGDGTKKKKICFSSLFGATILVIAFSGLPIRILASFSSSGINAGSTIARIGAWKYYFTKFLDNPLFGIGYAGDANYYKLVHGDSGIYFQTVLVQYDYSDCGFIGQMAKNGIFIFLIYIWPLAHFIKMCLKFIHMKQIIPGAFAVSLVGYLVFTSVTLIILDDSRVIAWPLIMAIVEYTSAHIFELK